MPGAGAGGSRWWWWARPAADADQAFRLACGGRLGAAKHVTAAFAKVRRKLRGEFGFPRSRDRYFGVPAVYSLENVRYPQPDGSVCGVRPAADADQAFRLACGGGLGAAMHVTAAFAMAAVATTLERLLRTERPGRPAEASADGEGT